MTGQQPPVDVLSLVGMQRALDQLSKPQPPITRLMLFVPPSAVERFQRFWGPCVDVRPYEDLAWLT